MGKIDMEAKAYLSNTEQFSDIFNFWIFDGKNVISLQTEFEKLLANRQ